MNWFFTVLLIAVSAGVVGYTGWLLRRLFTLEPASTVQAGAETGASS